MCLSASGVGSSQPCLQPPGTSVWAQPGAEKACAGLLRGVVAHRRAAFVCIVEVLRACACWTKSGHDVSSAEKIEPFIDRYQREKCRKRGEQVSTVHDSHISLRPSWPSHQIDQLRGLLTD